MSNRCQVKDSQLIVLDLQGAQRRRKVKEARGQPRQLVSEQKQCLKHGFTDQQCRCEYRELVVRKISST